MSLVFFKNLDYFVIIKSNCLAEEKKSFYIQRRAQLRCFNM